MIKKLSALLLALICAVSMTLPAYAEEHTNHGNVVDGMNATCTEAGFIEYEDGCKIAIEATGHKYSSVTTVYHCIDQAEITTYTCDTCTYTYDETIRNTTGEHTWETIDAVEATCQAVGNNGGKKCSECGVDKLDEVAIEIPQRTHELGDANNSLYLYGSTDTCVNDGKAIYKCKYCDYLVDTDEPIDSYCAVKNSASEYFVEKDAVAPSCFEDGKEADKYCKFCDVLAATGADIPATEEHDLELEGKVEATCHSDGYTGDMVCQTEGCTYVEAGSIVPATGEHNLKTVDAKEATCTEEGYTGDKVCQNDGCEYKEIGTVIGLKTHNYEIFYIVVPSCGDDNNGYGYDKCKDCGYYDPNTGHSLLPHSATLEVIPAVAPTCQETGLTEGQKCYKCERIIEEQTVVPVIPCDQEVSIPAKAATCTEDGYEDNGKKCSMCGAEKVAPTPVPALTHLQDTDIPAVAPTCTEDGSEGGKSCSRCGEISLDPTTVPALNHLQDVEIPAVAPTCTENGSKDGKSCSRCGEISLDPVVDPALGHLNDVTLEAKAPTCTNTGLTAGVQCSACDEVTTPQEVVPTVADAHVEKIIEAVEPTCTVPGATEGKVCSDCGYVLTSTTIVPSKGHANAVIELVNCAENVEGYTVYKCEVCGEESRHDCAHKEETLNDPATCTEPGRMEYACGYAYDIDALGHDKIITQAVAPTCTEKGATAGITCGRCLEIILTSTVIDELGHDIINNEAKAPTCTEIGWDAYETCSRCNHTTYVEKPALGHTLEDIPAVAATCISVGYTAGKGCTACDYIEVEPQVIPANGHSWVKDDTLSVAPSCSRDGKEVYYCKDCGETVEKQVYATGNHNYVIIETKAATCTEEGYSKNRCTVCGDSFIAPELPTGHTESIDKGFAATCTATGLTDGSHCGRCGDVLKEQVIIPVISHTSVAVTGYAATCETTGLTDGKSCSVCGTVIIAQNIIPALGHTKVEIPAVEATCTVNGLTAGTNCSVCGEKLEAQQIVYALGHKEVIVAGNAATCTATGLTEGKKCEVCDTVTVAQTVIPALGHKEITVKGVAATCTKTGLTDGKKCSVCNTVTYAQDVIPVIAHTTTTINKKSATYTKTGYSGDKVCKVCNKVISKGSKIAKKTLKAPKIKLTTSKRKINVKVSNVDKGATGYKIYYKKSGGSYKSKTYKSVKDLTKALTKLSSGKKYYVKVKVFVKSGSKTVYSKYSSVKTIKVK